MFTLFNVVASIITTIVDRVFGWDDWFAYAGPITTLYYLAVFLPSLAVAVRRLHDTNRSGWWILLGLVPLVGFIVLIVFYAQAGNVGTNKYGPDPKGAEDYAGADAPRDGLNEANRRRPALRGRAPQSCQQSAQGHAVCRSARSRFQPPQDARDAPHDLLVPLDARTDRLRCDPEL